MNLLKIAWVLIFGLAAELVSLMAIAIIGGLQSIERGDTQHFPSPYHELLWIITGLGVITILFIARVACKAQDEHRKNKAALARP